MIDLRLGDCLEVMRTLPDASVDAVITDIPYGISQKSGHLKGKELDFGEWDKFTDEQMAAFLDETRRLTKGTAFIFCSAEQMSGILKYFKDCDWLVRQLIWFKPGAFSMNGDKMYLWSTENIVYAKRRGATFNQKFKHNLFECVTERNGNRVHPTQKPVKLIVEFVEDSTNAGDLVLDPFMGSGSTGVACASLGRSFIGCEISPDYYAIAQRRIAEAQAQMTLPLEAAS